MQNVILLIVLCSWEWSFWLHCRSISRPGWPWLDTVAHMVSRPARWLEPKLDAEHWQRLAAEGWN